MAAGVTEGECIRMAFPSTSREWRSPTFLQGQQCTDGKAPGRPMRERRRKERGVWSLELLVPGHTGVHGKERGLSQDTGLHFGLAHASCAKFPCTFQRVSWGWNKSLLVDTESYAKWRPGNVLAVFEVLNWHGAILKHAPLESKLVFMPSEATSPWKLPTGIAKNNYCQTESSMSSPHG